MHSRTSHVQTTQGFCNIFKDHHPSYLIFNFGDNLLSRNQDMAQNVILLGGDLERSRLSRVVNNFSISPPPSTHKYMCEVSLRSYLQFF